MKKTVYGFVVLAALLLAACEQAALPGPAATGMGSVTVTLSLAGASGLSLSPAASSSLETAASTGAARTVAPVFSDDLFYSIKLIFTPEGDGEPVVHETATIHATVDVPEGTYTLTVIGYKTDNAPEPIARGTAAAPVVIVSGGNAAVAVILMPIEAGTFIDIDGRYSNPLDSRFRYDVTLPADAFGSLLTLTDKDGNVPLDGRDRRIGEIKLQAGSNTGMVHGIPPGIYRLALEITSGFGQVKFANEVVYLYGMLAESVFTRDFSSVNPIRPETATEALELFAALPPNDAEHPYTLDLGGFALADFSTTSAFGSFDPLGKIFAALDGKYINLDLSGCEGTEIRPAHLSAVSMKPNRSNLVSVILPDTLTSIGAYVFFECGSLTSVDLPDTLTSIGAYAFYGCWSLTSVDLPDTLTSIGNSAFQGCGSLTSIDLSDTLTSSIGNSAFQGCGSLAEVKLPDSLAAIGENAFRFTALRSIVLPENLTNMKGMNIFPDSTTVHLPLSIASVPFHGSLGFFSLSNISSVVLPDGLTHLNFDFNLLMPNLASIVLPDTLESIGSNVFEKCYSLTSVSLPDSLKSIPESAFKDCSGLKSVSLPAALKSIGSSAFYGAGLVSIDLPATLESIGEWAFKNCSSLESIDLSGAKLTVIEEDTFGKCGRLAEIKLPDQLESIGFAAFNGTAITSITLPASVNSIGNAAFNECLSLRSIVLPANLTFLGPLAFQGCKVLTSIVLPAKLNSVGAMTFNGCTSLASVTLPATVSSIGAYAFYKCGSLTSIDLPATVTSIADQAFAYCGSLTTVTSRNPTPPSLNPTAFNDTASSLSIYVPDGSMEDTVNGIGYKTRWSNYANRIKPLSEKP